MTVYLRKIPAEVQMVNILQQLQRQQGIPESDLQITQTIPNADFRGQWKFMKCEGPSSALERVTKACEEGKLPWKVSPNPPSCAQPFFMGLSTREDGTEHRLYPHPRT